MSLSRLLKVMMGLIMVGVRLLKSLTHTLQLILYCIVIFRVFLVFLCLFVTSLALILSIFLSVRRSSSTRDTYKIISRGPTNRSCFVGRMSLIFLKRIKVFTYTSLWRQFLNWYLIYDFRILMAFTKRTSCCRIGRHTFLIACTWWTSKGRCIWKVRRAARSRASRNKRNSLLRDRSGVISGTMTHEMIQGIICSCVLLWRHIIVCFMRGRIEWGSEIPMGSLAHLVRGHPVIPRVRLKLLKMGALGRVMWRWVIHIAKEGYPWLISVMKKTIVILVKRISFLKSLHLI